MKMTCSVIRGAAGLVATGTALACLAGFGFVWTVVDGHRRRSYARTWGDARAEEYYGRERFIP